MPITHTTHQNNFLRGGGEMGELIRNYNWERSSLGKPEQWPLSLKTTVGTILHSAFPMFLFWGRELLCFYNDAYRPSLGNDGKHSLIGKGGKEAWPDIWDFIGPLIEKVIATAEPVFFEDQFLPIYRNGKMEDVYWTFSYSPAYGDTGQVEGVFVTCTETTQKVLALRELQENANRFRALVEEAPVATCLLTGRDMKVEIINDIMIGYWGKGNTVLGKTLIEALPELKDQPFLKLLDDVYTTGKTHTQKGAFVELEVDGVKGEYYYDFTYKPMRNSAGEVFGIINVSVDATERVLAQRNLENSQKDLLSYFEQSPVAIATIDKEDLTFRMANPFYGELVGRKPEELINKPLLTALPELEGQGFDTLLEQVIETGVPFIANEVAADIKRKGAIERIYVNLAYQPQKNAEGKIPGILVVATDVTQQVVSRQKVEESEASLRSSEARFRGLIMDAPIATCVFTGKDLRLELANDMMLSLWDKDSSIIGMTLKEALYDLDVDPVIEILNEVYASGKPHNQYGAKREVTFNGKKQTLYFNLTYKPLFNEAGEVYAIMDMAVDVTGQVETRLAIEEAVTTRTAQLAQSNLNLKRSNLELEQFAYIASHDLQEPVRKISTFLQLLERSLPNIPDKAKDYVAKIYSSTDRMTKLIRDVLAFSQIAHEKNEFEKVDLTKIMDAVNVDFELQIQETGAIIELSGLPIIEAMPSQMSQLFSNLMSNSLKYVRPGVQPLITISASIAKKENIAIHPILDITKTYYHIRFSDNGIGFSPEHAEKIFRIFQRLHGKKEFEGTGIGLSICQKIVLNHAGHIAAAQGINGGAVFHILLPAGQAFREKSLH